MEKYSFGGSPVCASGSVLTPAGAWEARRSRKLDLARYVQFRNPVWPPFGAAGETLTLEPQTHPRW